MLPIIGVLAKLISRSTLNSQYEYSGSNKLQMAFGSTVYEITATNITEKYKHTEVNEKFILSFISKRLIDFGFQESTGYTLMRMGGGLIFSNRGNGTSFVIKCTKCEYDPPYQNLMSYTSVDFLDMFNCISSNDTIRCIEDNDVKIIVNAISDTCSSGYPEHTTLGMYAKEDEFIESDGKIFYMQFFPYTTNKSLNIRGSDQMFKVTITPTRKKN